MRICITHILNLSEKIRKGIQADLHVACEKKGINGLGVIVAKGIQPRWAFLLGLNVVAGD